MTWFCILLALFALLVDAGNYPIENASCEQNEYNLDHTLALGRMNDWIVQVTINLELIMYPYQSLSYFTLSNGIGDNLASLYPGLNNLTTYRMIAKLAINDLLSMVSFSVQNENNVPNIYGYFYREKDLNYFKQSFNQSTDQPIEYTHLQSASTYMKIISFWTGNDTEFNIIQLVVHENPGPYILYYANRQNQNQMIVFVCLKEQSMMSTRTISPNCIGSKDWIKQIRFGFIHHQRLYFVSIDQRKVWYITMKLILNSNEYFPLKTQELDQLFNCARKRMADNGDDNSTDSFNILRILIITLCFLISLIIIIVIICTIFRQCSEWKKRKYLSTIKSKFSEFKSSSSLENCSTDYEINYLPPNKKHYMLFQYKVDTYLTKS